MLLYDLTSTYFEGQCAEIPKGKFGHNRDGQKHCRQVVVALVVTPDGLPLAYEVLVGNTSDKSTLRNFLAKIESLYGKARRVWVMDRGIPTEQVLKEMRDSGTSYLVGTLRATLDKLQNELADKPWVQLHEGVRARVVTKKDGDTYVQVHSAERNEKETAIRRRKFKQFVRRAARAAAALAPRNAQGRRGQAPEGRQGEEGEQRQERGRREKRGQRETEEASQEPRDILVGGLAVLRKEAGKVAALVSVTIPAEGDAFTSQSFHYELNREKLAQTIAREGSNLLRTNLPEKDPAKLWPMYTQLTWIEAAFKAMKSDLGIRPVYHYVEPRVEAHILVAFLGYCLMVALRKKLEVHAPGLTPQDVLKQLATIKMVDVCLPTTDSRWLVLPRYTEPEAPQQALLKKLKLELPKQPPPRLRGTHLMVPERD